jgi:hypothetical protein
MFTSRRREFFLPHVALGVLLSLARLVSRHCVSGSPFLAVPRTATPVRGQFHWSVPTPAGRDCRTGSAAAYSSPTRPAVSFVARQSLSLGWTSGNPGSIALAQSCHVRALV